MLVTGLRKPKFLFRPIQVSADHYVVVIKTVH
jgi:hypothetical protein